jgi:tellurite resistance protein TerC
MAKSLALLDRNNVAAFFQDTLRESWGLAFAKDNNYTLFRYEDWPAWVIFTSVFLVLITFDNVILHRNPQALTVTRAIFYTLFWICMACCFCGWVAWWYNPASAYMWMSGYMLEWMLSFDNLFVFHLIFSVYGCPDNLKHRPLYLGIMGAVVFRLAFIFIGEYLMHAMAIMHFVFGSFLVYTGIKTVSADEDDEDPSQQPLVMWLQSRIPFVSVYDKNGCFFVKCPVKDNGEHNIPEEAMVIPEPEETDRLVNEDGEESKKVAIVDFASLANHGTKFQTRATMLFLVVVCLEVSDILFAVDSVSAIVAQVNDLFLAYTSAVFAMLGLRATFFIIDVLVQLFSLLKYGVAIVLVFIGIKLIIGKFYHVPASIVCVILVSAIAGSMVASVIQEKIQKKYEGKMSPEIAERVAKIKGSPFASPSAIKKAPAVA